MPENRLKLKNSDCDPAEFTETVLDILFVPSFKATVTGVLEGSCKPNPKLLKTTLMPISPEKSALRPVGKPE